MTDRAAPGQNGRFSMMAESRSSVKYGNVFPDDGGIGAVQFLKKARLILS